jgi:hypothetical protein
MGLYLATPGYGGYGLTNSSFAGNKIFDCKGNGNNVFVWGAASNYHALGNSDYTGTVIEDNEIYGSHRSGIEIAGGVDNLTIRDNTIRDNSGLSGEESNLKYGNGILVIRTTGDKVTGDAYGPDHLSIISNTITSNEKNGIYMGPINSNHVITGNVMTDNGWDGVRLDLEESYHSGATPVYTRTEALVLNKNEVLNNDYGARVIGTPQNGFVLDARLNWWGDASGPGGEGPGSGDEVSANVMYCPWLDNVPSSGSATSANGNLVTNTDTGEMFCAIQPAIDDSDTVNGHTIDVSAGTYTETVDISKTLTLNGETGVIILPDENIPSYASNREGAIIWVDAPNVTIRNLTIDGDNPDITGGNNVNGADVNAFRGIYLRNRLGRGCYDNLTVESVTLRNLARGVNPYCGQNHTIQDNLAYNLGGPDGNYGYGILTMGSTSAQILNNRVMTVTTGGVFVQNNHSANDTLISGNVITNAGIGLGWNMLYGTPHNGVVENNTVYSASLGMQVTSIQLGNLTVQNNHFTLTQPDSWGFLVWNTYPDTVFINHNTVEGGDIGVRVYDNSSSFGFGQAYLNMADNIIDGAVYGIVSSSESSNHPVVLTARDNTIRNIITTGMVISGSEALTATVVGGTLDTIPTVFDVSDANADLTAYANNIDGFGTGVNATAGTVNAMHNWWGAIDPTGVGDTDAYDFRLGAPVVSYTDGTSSVSLADANGGDASLIGNGTLVIVNHDVGVPFGKGIPADTGGNRCADFYDFFAIGGSGSYNVSIPVKAACTTAVISDTLFEFALTASYAPDTSCTPDTACWNSVTANRSGDLLTASGLSVNDLLGTPFAAPSVNNNDPTALTLDAFGATSTPIWLPIAGLLVSAATVVIVRRKQR